eukprot:CAMPEP_0168474312 /NCGR_PEP_ID=MMETSP0228-20121227/60776_1 /TAXON_ID=133427 /ORGANISM="Protoceratium reticulatum, Strain CCCM 535 (=CCMP 1889)" /LENGTH=371 /DNA_ID=CAMNT_0008490335 /DNA_START=39 /DNA_END=1154 /DNA_ORIENTATION=-
MAAVGIAYSFWPRTDGLICGPGKPCEPDWDKEFPDEGQDLLQTVPLIFGEGRVCNRRSLYLIEQIVHSEAAGIVHIGPGLGGPNLPNFYGFISMAFPKGNVTLVYAEPTPDYGPWLVSTTTEQALFKNGTVKVVDACVLPEASKQANMYNLSQRFFKENPQFSADTYGDWASTDKFNLLRALLQTAGTTPMGGNATVNEVVYHISPVGKFFRFLKFRCQSAVRLLRQLFLESPADDTANGTANGTANDTANDTASDTANDTLAAVLTLENYDAFQANYTQGRTVRCITPASFLDEAGLEPSTVGMLRVDPIGFNVELVSKFLDVPGFSPRYVELTWRSPQDFGRLKELVLKLVERGYHVWRATYLMIATRN